MGQTKMLIVFRHGHYEHNSIVGRESDVSEEALRQYREEHPDKDDKQDLSQRGVEEVVGLRRFLGDMRSAVQVCLTSPYPRAKTSADIVFADTQVPRRVVSCLYERKLGDFEFLPPKHFHTHYPVSSAEKRQFPLGWKPPGGESLREVAARVRPALEEADRLAPDGIVAISTHADVMVAMRSLPELLALTTNKRMTRPLTPVLQNPQWVQNCQADFYAREDPRTGQVFSEKSFFRSVATCGKKYDTGWIRIDK